MRFPGELEELEKVRSIAQFYGYGNCIQYLQHAWAKSLHEQGLPLDTAARGATMHKDDVDAYVKGFRILKEDYKED